MRIVATLALALVAVALAPPGRAAASPPATVLMLAPGATRADAYRIAESRGGEVTRAIPQLNAYLVEGITRLARRSLLDTGLVLSAEPNTSDRVAGIPRALARTVDDEFRSLQWSLDDVGADTAWDQTFGDPHTVIAIVDTGVDYTNPDLAGKVIVGPDIAMGDADPMDVNGHGTIVAGIAAAIADNRVGIAGACPGCSIMAIKVVPDNGSSATKFDSSAGIVWAADHGAQVINLSIGSDQAAPVQEQAVEYAWQHGSLVVASAGNESTPTIEYPAGYDNVLAVGATTQRDQMWRGSSYGNWVDLAAPGQGLLALGISGGFVRRDGTSFAAPLVSGAAGLIVSLFPGIGNAGLSTALVAGTRPVPPFAPGRTFARGRIDFPLALAKAAALGSPSLTIVRLASSPDAPFVSDYPRREPACRSRSAASSSGTTPA